MRMSMQFAVPAMVLPNCGKQVPAVPRSDDDPLPFPELNEGPLFPPFSL